MKPQERIAQLEKELAAVIEQRDGLKHRVDELLAAKPVKVSKSRTMAEEGLKLVQAAGTKGVPLTEMAKLNPKYPSDVAYFIRTILNVDLRTVRKTAAGTVYMTPEHFTTYQAEQAAAKATAEAAKAEVKKEAEAAAPAPEAPKQEALAA